MIKKKEVKRLSTNVYRVAVVTICLNQNYWPYLGKMVDSARKFFLQGHQVDYFTWSDMPKDHLQGIKVFPTKPFDWPQPTLNRYHLFLQQEKVLEEYDFIFYIDADMLFVARVGNEVFGPDLTGAQHPMYAVDMKFIPPYEPNSKSTAYIPRPGRIIEKDGKKRLEPIYWAGGFQGGRSDSFIKAMKVMKENISTDYTELGYISIWNDESHWNKYCFDNPPSVTLSPEYVYPDSLNRAYYQKVWGKNFIPRLVTLTKPFSLSKEGGANLQNTLQNI